MLRRARIVLCHSRRTESCVQVLMVQSLAAIATEDTRKAIRTLPGKSLESPDDA
jgi:hypothetical protein